MSAGQASGLAAVAGATLALALLGVALAGEATGLYHDDGIYASSARAIASGDGYRLSNLPLSPPATKYPPLYPALLSVVWRAAPDFPANLPFLKAVNAVLIALLVPIVYAWTARLDGFGRAERLAAGLLAATSPGLFWLGDVLLSEPLFVVLAALLMTVGERGPWTVRRAFGAGLLAGLAVLARLPGVALAAAAGVLIARESGRRPLTAFLAGLGLLAVPWWAWQAASPAPAGPLEAYYRSYEPSMWTHLAGDPAIAIRAAVANAGFFLTSAPAAFGLPAPWLAIAGAVLAAAGAWRLRRTWTARLAALWAAITAVGLLGHPYPMARYLVPFVVVAVVLVVAACAAGAGVRGARGNAGAGRLVRFAPVVLLLGVNALWMGQYRTVTAHGLHGEFGRALPWDHAGFVETARWIRTHTPPEARLASAHDAYYAVHTERAAIRPWVHRPEEYTPAYGRHLASGPETERVQADLDRLAVCFLIVDPLLEGGEGEHGRRTLEALVGAPGGPWRPIFTTGGRWEHRIYRREGGGVACPPGLE